MHYVILKTCFYHNNTSEPYTECLPVLFNTRNDAEEALKLEAKKEMEVYEKAKTKDSLKFKADDCSDYEYVIRAWDGDDYEIVTIYGITMLTDNYMMSEVFDKLKIMYEAAQNVMKVMPDEKDTPHQFSDLFSCVADFVNEYHISM